MHWTLLWTVSCLASVRLGTCQSVEMNPKIVEYARHFLNNYKDAKYETQNQSALPTVEVQMKDFLADLNAKNDRYQMARDSTNYTELLGIAALHSNKTQCLSGSVMLKLLPVTQTQDLANAVTQLCPLILLNADGDSEESCADEESDEGTKRSTTIEIWGYGVLSVAIISACSLGGVLVLPFLGKVAYETCITVFEGLAVGSLLSSALFQLLPEAFDLHLLYPAKEYLMKSLLIFIGIYVFYLMEHLMKYVFAMKKERKSKLNVHLKKYTNNSQAHLFANSQSVTSLANGDVRLNEKGSKPYDLDGIYFVPTCSEKVTNDPQDLVINGSLPISNEKPTDCSKIKNKFSPKEENQDQTIETIAWMIIFGDGFHNFIDGISVGASFTTSILSGFSISLAIFCEEFPHELGDFAVLLSAGMSVKQAVIYNFLSACTCFAGLVVGILLGDLTSGSPLIFAFATGMFLYISLVDMMDEINTKLKAAVEEEGYRKGIKVWLLQNLGIWLGFTLLFTLSYFGDDIHLDD